MNLNHSLFRLVLAILLVPCSVFARINIEVKPDTRTVFIGETFTLTVKVSSLDPDATPDFSETRGMKFRLIDRSTQSFQQIRIINGKRTSTGFSGTVFTYQV